MSNNFSLADANKHLSRLGIAPIGTFRSTMLPGAGLDPTSLSGYYDHTGRPVSLEGEDLEELQEAAQDLSDYGGIPSMTPDYIVEGISSPNDGEVSPTDSADNNRSIGVPGERRNWSESREKSFSEKRREAFLNPANRGYAAIRAADAATGRYRQGNDFYYKIDGQLQKVNEETWRKGQHRQLSPEELKEGYADAVKKHLAPVDTNYATPITTETSEAVDVDWSRMNVEDFDLNNTLPGLGQLSDKHREDLKGKYFSEGNDDEE